jgi:hypothetical protein
VLTFTAAICIGLGQKLFPLTDAHRFTLIWMHSVEKIQWEEDWMLENNQLFITAARIKGSGAGMDPPEDAVFTQGFWHYKPLLSSQTELRLTHSRYTPDYVFCIDGNCHSLNTLVPLSDNDTTVIVKACPQ